MILHFTKQEGVFSEAIRGFDSGYASHIGCESSLAPGIVIDSSFKHRGVRAFEKDNWLNANILVESVSVFLSQEESAVRWLIDQIGKPYDVKAIIGMPFLRDWEDESSFYCTELAILACIKGGRTIRTRPSEIGLRLAHELAFSWSENGNSS